MCGFAGVLTTETARKRELESAVGRMAETLVHRGPDDASSWADPEAGIGLGFRRLSIIDLSPAGRQPMHSHSGRFVIVFNGEIYNHRELRRNLEHGETRFKGRSDTEVIAAAFDRWGIRPAVEKFRGMFAIAAWDRESRRLTLVRDRLGIKPLFIYCEPGYVAFASELKALAAGPRFDADIDRSALAAYLRFLYVPAPRSIYRRVRKLRPGHILQTSNGSTTFEETAYWDVHEAARRGLENPVQADDRQATELLDDALRDAVACRLEADVPLGALLSGGIDSTSVVACMQEASSRPIRTYSIGFESKIHDEARYARAVATHLGTAHTEFYVTGDEALAVVPRLPEIFDEPLADASEIPVFLVARLARQEVTVALSGDGGDEIFAGYNRYAYGERVVTAAARVPASLRRALSSGLGAVSTDSWDRIYERGRMLLRSGARHRLVGAKVVKLANMLRWGNPDEMYRSFLSAWQRPDSVVIGAAEQPTSYDQSPGEWRPDGMLERMLLADQLEYLPDDLLAKTDRASMAVSLEVRVPLVDHRLVELAWRLPRHMKIRDGVGKWILRQVLYSKVPRQLVDRPKVGFSVPLDEWLLGPLREWAEDLLAPEQLSRGGLLRPEPVVEAWNRLKARRTDLALPLWAILVFQAWRQRWLD